MIFASSSQQKFNSVICYYCADTANVMPITETAKFLVNRKKKQKEVRTCKQINYTIYTKITAEFV
jgi:hypothetical protein